MVVCSFYLKGTCKFGNKCRYEHTSSTSSNTSFTNPRQSTFGQQNDRYHYNKSATSLVDHNTILQAVRKELQEWETNKVWPFSCFAAQREQKCLSGLEDHCPEELRLEAYNYKSNNDFQTYVNGLSGLTTQVISRRNQLKTMSNEQLLQELQSSISGSTAAVPAAGTAANIFATPSTNLFSTGAIGQSTPSSGGLFGSSSSSTSLFSKSTGGLFGGTTTSTTSNPFFSSTGGGLFTSNPTTSASAAGLFGTSSSAISNPFITKTTSSFSSGGGGIFGGSTTSAQPLSGGLFGSSSPSVASPFAASAATAASTPLNNPFATLTATTSSGLFAKPAGSLFGGVPTTPATAAQPSVAVNPFLATPQQQQQQQLQQQQQRLGVSSTTTTTTETVCSVKVPPVTPADIEKFKAPKFVLGQIPTCPPPIELCG